MINNLRYAFLFYFCKNLSIFILGIGVFCLFYVLYPMGVWCLKRSEKGIRFPGTGVKDDSEPHCICWELTLAPCKSNKWIILTHDSSLQPQDVHF